MLGLDHLVQVRVEQLCDEVEVVPARDLARGRPHHLVGVGVRVRVRVGVEDGLGVRVRVRVRVRVDAWPVRGSRRCPCC